MDQLLTLDCDNNFEVLRFVSQVKLVGSDLMQDRILVDYFKEVDNIHNPKPAADDLIPLYIVCANAFFSSNVNAYSNIGKYLKKIDQVSKQYEAFRAGYNSGEISYNEMPPQAISLLNKQDQFIDGDNSYFLTALYSGIQFVFKHDQSTEIEDEKEKKLEEFLLKHQDRYAPDSKIPHEEGFSNAVYKRGHSFIAAAQQIISYAKIYDETANTALLAVQKFKEHWNAIHEDKELAFNQEHLARLQRDLIDEINLTLYSGMKSFKKVKDELDNAENHINWIPQQNSEAIMDMPGTNMRREHIPVTKFTARQTKEWTTIVTKGAQKPKWFQVLAPWEQNLLQQRILDWQQNHSKQNLGEFLGPLPTTIRRYPGAPNAYHSHIRVQNAKERFDLHKIRSGVIAPTKLKADSNNKRVEKINLTLQNLEQLLAEGIRAKMDCLHKASFDGEVLDLPVMLQTLYSPPVQPPGHYNNESIMKALDIVRARIAYDPKKFLNHIGLSEDDLKGYDVRLDVLYSNRPVNKLRGLSWFLSRFTRSGGETRHAQSTMRAYLDKKVQAEWQEVKGPKKTYDDLSPNLRMAAKAYHSYDKIRIFGNTMMSFKDQDHNPLAEKAALEQIIMNGIGIRVGSCVSGKDREHMIEIIATAQMQFFAKHGTFPPPHGSEHPNDIILREEFTELVARNFLLGDGHLLAERNANGCAGLKNIQDVFGRDICRKIESLKWQYGIKANYQPVKEAQKAAGLNKLSVKKLLKKALAYLPVINVTQWVKKAHKIDDENPNKLVAFRISKQEGKPVESQAPESLDETSKAKTDNAASKRSQSKFQR